MAEVLAGLLTSAVVGIAKDKLASAIAEKANLLWNFDGHLEHMMAVLETISAALEDAERRSVKDKLVQLWLKRLKNAALDISDMLEDYQDTSRQLAAKVPGVLSCLPIARKKINVASRMKSIREELGKINKEFHDFKFSNGGTTNSVEQLDDVRETSSRLPNEPIIGRNAEKQEVINLLSAGTNNEETLIVAIYGLGGIGKSTLAQQIYNDVHSKKYDHRIWVYVSQVFSLRKIGSSIISLLPIEGGQKNMDTVEAINQCLDTQLHGKKVLIVLDDLWQKENAELQKLRSMLRVGNGSMIDVIVTTRDEDIARNVSTSEPYKLQPLKDATCWEIIKRTSRFEQKHNQQGFKQIGLDIAKKCGGVALAAAAVGYLLQSKQLSEWTEINNSDIWNEYSEDGVSVLPSLKLTYERMPPQLKICFSYCAIFEKGHNITEDDLIHQWTALDFIEPSMGKKYIRQLLGMSFLQVSKLPLRMQNEVLPEYITELAKLQYLNLNGSSGISALPESIGKLSGCLEFLGLSGCSGISKLPESFGDLKCMMYLDLSGCSRIEELPDSLGDLTNLQHLELSQCSRLKVIPESLCGLTHLQYLNLSSCACIVRLPEAVGCLVDLKYLNISRCQFRELPESFKRLTNLLRLNLECCYIEKGLPGALRGLTALQHLSMSNSTSVENLELDDLPDAMRNLTNLEHLDLSDRLNVENNDGYLDFIGSLTSLEHLDLSMNDILEYLPESIGNLKRLHTLNLEYCSSLKSLPESIGGATGLKSLLLDGCSHELMDQASSLLHYSLTLPLFNVRADDVSAKSNLHLLQGENSIGELNIVSLENVRFLEEAQRLKLVTKQNLVNLTLSWTKDADRNLEDKDLLGELVPPMSLQSFCLQGYSSPSFPSWLMAISHHLPNLTSIDLDGLPKCSNLPPLGQLPCLESLCLSCSPSITKIDSGFCGGKGAFPRLENVRVSKMDGLEEWNTTYTGEAGVEEFMFPVLQVLEVSWCPRLRLKPCPPKCHRIEIAFSDQVISSLEDVETSSHYLRNPTPITTLHIGGSERQSFRLFHHFPALQELYISNIENLTSLPVGIKQLSSLQRLKLSYYSSCILALPEWLSDISSLKELTIYGCRSIKSLPQCIQQLTNLQKLFIGQNEELRQWCESEENKAKLAHINDIIYKY